ncbi:MAG: CDP-diacylglycerol--glycerol-3-phosphate 3-phosphatidyltransferase [Nitrospirae bacterium]|nr:CDP-diacylglycerol--glycerol-3-phosphate 3-phosphatidyltransferase [Nitrospirota bacterium]
MNLPNFLTTLRILLIPVFIIALLYGEYGLALGLFALAGVTDGLDGFIARSRHQQTRLGSYLDPIADKLLLDTSFITLAVLQELPVWLAVIVLSRDVAIVVGSAVLYMQEHALKVFPSWLGKGTTFLQLVLVAVTLLFMNFGGDPLLHQLLIWAVAAFTILSGLHYIARGIGTMKLPLLALLLLMAFPGPAWPDYLFEMKNGRILRAEGYVDEGGRYRVTIHGGTLWLEKAEVEKIRKESGKKPDPPPAKPGKPKSRAPAAAESPPQQTQAVAPHPQEARETDREGRDAEWWRDRAQKLRARVAELRQEDARLTQEIDELEKQWGTAPEHLKREEVRDRIGYLRIRRGEVKRILEEQVRILEHDLPDEARKAEAPPGWLRQ